MSGPQVDWTLEDIPEETPRRAKPSTAPLPNQPTSQSKPRWRWRRKHILVGLVVCTILGGAGWLYWQIGWWRLEAQVLAQVRYEDARGYAQDTAAVLAAQTASDNTWREIRAAETEQGWASPLPAPNLLPLPEPALLSNLQTGTEGVFTATVVRAFSDAAGQRYEFSFIQVYRNLQPGVWERLGPAPAIPNLKSERWEGVRLRVLYDPREAQWVTQNAAALDALLMQACVDWGCAERHKLTLTFANDLAHWPAAVPPVRAPDLPNQYPLIFDLPIAYGASIELILSSPWLTGYPRNPASERLYFRTVAVSLLAQLADSLSASTRTPSNYFLDALIAQEEIALGLTPAPEYALTPATFIPLTKLWRNMPIGATPSQPSLHLRLQVLHFLLTGTPATASPERTSLLKTLHQQSSLPEWLEKTFPGNGKELVARWQQTALATFAQNYAPQWASLAGLLYTCQDTVPTLITAQGPVTLPVQTLATPNQNALAPNQMQVAVFQPRPNRRVPELQIFDLTTQTLTPVQAQSLPNLNNVFVLGWAANGDLWYLDNNRQNKQQVWLDDYPSRLMYYSPQTGVATPVMPEAYFFAISSGPTPWNSEHTQLVLLQIVLNQDRVEQTYATHITIGPNPVVKPLNIAGIFPLFHAQHAEVIYATNNFFGLAAINNPNALIAHDLQTGITQTLITTQDLPQTQDSLALMAVSPNGAHVVFSAFLRDFSQSYLLALDNHELMPLFAQSPTQPFSWFDFSPQGRYVSALTQSASDLTPLQVLDLHQSHPYLYWKQTTTTDDLGIRVAQPNVWSPNEQWLAVNGPTGFYVTNPTTQSFQWITNETCHAASWSK